ncbi:hypothetical protein DY000_02001544 [Brassica cretica]|uniref:Uncharacterized protein n=1 Tax=Brassica cretica TaxID=69181 RepID=A0ABQ7C5K2_BRACR|nr:hypothetical protein DY000_02001544 [Brassica cretica]
MDVSDLQEDLMVEEDSMDDLIRDRFRLSAISIAEVEAHRNDNLAASLRSLCNELKAKEPQSERKRKKVSTKKDDKASSSNAGRTTDL